MPEAGAALQKDPLCVSACPLCDKTRLKTAAHWKGGCFSQCRSCGFLFQNPPPTTAESRAFYETAYYEELKALEQKIRTAREPLYREVLALLEPARRTGRLLDVGAGFGDFMRAAQAAGWEAWGLEPSLEACQTARGDFGDRVICGTSDEAVFDSGFFDVITLWNVLDCLPDPRQTVSRLREWLRPGGLLVIRTPNAGVHLALHRFYRFFQPLCQAAGWKKDPAVFLRSNFNAATLRRFLCGAGFGIASLSNGPVTSGDPYGVMRQSGSMALLKGVFQAMVRSLSFLSAGRILAGTNLLVLAEKADDAAPAALASRLHSRLKLKRWVLHFLAALGYALGLPLWRRLRQKGGESSVLLYHSVVDGVPGEMSVALPEFRRQMQFIKEKFTLVSATEIAAELSSPQTSAGDERAPDKNIRGRQSQKRTLRKPVAITFDDGYEDNYTQAYPVLKESGLSATFFLLSGESEGMRETTHLGHARDYYPHHLLTWDQVHAMAEGGMEFGSHGESHSRLGTLGPEDLKREIERSKATLEAKTGRPVKLFSYPYGTAQDFDRRTMQTVREAGYQGAFSAIFGTNGTDADRYAMKRISVEAADSLFTLRAKLNGALDLLSLFHWKPLRSAIRALDRFFLRLSPRQPAAAEPLLIASVDFPPHTDGVSTIAGQIATRISQRRSGVFILGPSDLGDRAYDEMRHYTPCRVPGYDWGYLRMLPFAAAFKWLILGRGIRRIFVLNIAYGGLLAWLLSFPLRLKYVIFAYGYEFEKVRARGWMRQLYLQIYSRAEKMIACSEEVRRRLIDFGVPGDKVVCLNPAVDLSRYFSSPVPEEYIRRHGFAGRRIILTVGRLVERKGHDQTLRALQRLAGEFPDVLYCISGKGDFESRLRTMTQELGLQNHVRFMGRVEDEELRYLYNLCEFFIMPSREIEANGHIEGFGIVFLEANAFGKPVIGGRSGGMADAVTENETGLLVDPHSVDDIAEKMRLYLSKPEYARELGQKGLEHVRHRSNWDTYTAEAYRHLMGEELP